MPRATPPHLADALVHALPLSDLPHLSLEGLTPPLIPRDPSTDAIDAVLSVAGAPRPRRRCRLAEPPQLLPEPAASPLRPRREHLPLLALPFPPVSDVTVHAVSHPRSPATSTAPATALCSPLPLLCTRSVALPSLRECARSPPRRTGRAPDAPRPRPHAALPGPGLSPLSSPPGLVVTPIVAGQSACARARLPCSCRWFLCRSNHARPPPSLASTARADALPSPPPLPLNLPIVRTCSRGVVRVEPRRALTPTTPAPVTPRAR
nr:protein IQ-DOMAIN 14-like [Aegilops tauschii subsp. strangulata]